MNDEQCSESDDGKHKPDGFSARQADGAEFIVDYICAHCGCSGSAAVFPEEISFD